MPISFILPVLVSSAGIFLLFKLRFFFLIHPIRTLKRFGVTLLEKHNRRALSLALAGTLGVGNIFGVAAGIMIGGAGSVFWMMTAGIFSMIIKYAEALLASDSLTDEGGGMHLVIKDSLKKAGGNLSCLYALLCLALSLFMGSAIQSRAVFDVSRSVFAISPILFALIFSFLIFVSVLEGAKKIEKISAFIIPLTTIIYISLAISVIFANFSKFPDAIKSVINNAFSPLSGAGGAVGFLTSRTFCEGFSRGILSNEAGIGTSAMAHSGARDRTPAEAGLSGMCEVFFDTLLLCPLTAFMILVSVEDISDFSTPMSLVSFSVESSLGKAAALLLTFCILAFAYSTVTCWYYYGTRYTAYLAKGKLGWLFPPLFFSFILVGAVFGDEFLLFSSDVIILLMSFLTLSVIIKEIDRIKSLTQKCGLIDKI